ncbi:HK97-gp10 family putative phage morphogenesis protein [Paenibacillus donghaensis]|uniref:HK97 gp10 family phage protein n=1 Tax=Paenibacillus donghaensis TaxID=414771 RepID=A0A2Z2KNZ6_9BACL|nr:HK97-gp10 family putative phage morphogenesis protein [Paenibacillus donghaensis]ASA25420.1 hypothetical protein B9T62_34625 [Paenibacillus donghaensis]
MVSLQLEGMDEIRRMLEGLAEKKGKAENKALRAGALVIKDAAELRAPRSRSQKEHLADNIVVTNVRTDAGAKYILVGPQRGDNNKFFYGKFQEFGTSKMAARPFMGPAAVEGAPQMVTAMAEAVRREMR